MHQENLKESQMTEQCFFINGQFWQDDEIPKEIHGKLVLVPRSLEVFFHGFVGRSQMARADDKVVDGYMTDTFGHSTINDFRLSENSYATELAFTKQYSHDGSAPVSYKLLRSVGNEIGNDYFAGDWSIGTEGIIIACGKARCALTPIPEHFFKKPK